MPAIVGKTKNFLAFGCVHRPMHDKESWAWLIETIEERQPSILINLGDYGDNACVSSWRNGEEQPLIDEYRSIEEGTTELNDVSPKSKKVLMLGNHDERILRPEFAKLSDCLDIKKHVRPLRKWKVIEYQEDRGHTYTFGQITCCHGFSVQLSTIKREAVDLGVPYGLYIHAHTHKPEVPRKIMLTISTSIPWWYANVGCLIDFAKAKKQYMKKKNDSHWGHALIYGWASTKRRHDGQRNWEAELIKRKMAWD